MEWGKYQSERANWNTIEIWHKTYPGCNWGIICGQVSGNLIVLDFDDMEIYHKIFPNHEELEQETTVVKTSRGVHVYLHGITESKDVFTNSGVKLVEIRSKGRYVVAPGSKHHTGVLYEYINNSNPQ